jgi:hypothetical protein
MLFEKVNSIAGLPHSCVLQLWFFLDKNNFTDGKDVLCVLHNFVDDLLVFVFEHIFEFLVAGLIKSKVPLTTSSVISDRKSSIVFVTYKFINNISLLIYVKLNYSNY